MPGGSPELEKGNSDWVPSTILFSPLFALIIPIFSVFILLIFILIDQNLTNKKEEEDSKVIYHIL